MEKKMFYKSNPLIFSKAKELRNHTTHAEMIRWGYLKTKPMGYKFRRQHPVGNYIVDFFCYKLKLVIEADGGIHKKDEIKKYDKLREDLIKAEGLKIIRFTNEQIKNKLAFVIGIIHTIMLTTIEEMKKREVNTPPLGGWEV